jgi:hypothetical protein
MIPATLEEDSPGKVRDTMSQKQTNKKTNKRVGGMAQVVEHLHSTYTNDALCSILALPKNSICFREQEVSEASPILISKNKNYKKNQRSIFIF